MTVDVLSGVRARMKQALQDENSSAGGSVLYSDSELDQAIQDCLEELSLFSPREVIESATSNGTNDVDVSDIDDLIRVRYAEYPTGNTPKNLRNVSRFADTVTLAMTSDSTEDDTIYLYCEKYHLLTDTSSTLNERQTQLLVRGAAGKAAMSKALAYMNRVSAGGTNIYYVLSNWGKAMYEDFQRDIKSMRPIRRTMRYAED